MSTTPADPTADQPCGANGVQLSRRAEGSAPPTATRTTSVSTPTNPSWTAPDACPAACRQLAPGSALLDGIDDESLPDGLPWLSIWTQDDETVQPPDSARLDGAVNLPIIHFSVYWWNSLHQGSSMFTKGALPPVYALPLGLMMVAYLAGFGSLWLTRIRGEVWRRRAEAAAVRAARA